MNIFDLVLRTIMLMSTISLFLYGFTKGYDLLELFTYNIYFVSLISYLIKTNFLNKGELT